jgi:hypothetical protein
MVEKQIIIRDARRRQMYKIDDLYIDEYARLCGPNSTAIYNSLCRHAGGKQESYPSIEKMMEQHGIKSKHTVINAIKKLESFRIISVSRERDPKTKRQMRNVYTLMDVSTWVKPGVKNAPGKEYDPGAQNALGAGCISLSEPGAKNAQNPGAPNAPEGYTVEGYTKEGSDTRSASAPVCSKEGCKGKAMRGVELCEAHQPMNCQQFVDWYRKSDQRHIQIIAEFVDELRIAGIAPDMRTVAQWRQFVNPFRGEAAKLVVFDDDQLGTAMKRMMAATWVTDFNLVTLKKFLINSKK